MLQVDILKKIVTHSMLSPMFPLPSSPGSLLVRLPFIVVVPWMVMMSVLRSWPASRTIAAAGRVVTSPLPIETYTPEKSTALPNAAPSEYRHSRHVCGPDGRRAFMHRLVAARVGVLSQG